LSAMTGWRSRAQGLMITRIVLSIEATGGGEYLDLPAVMKLAKDPQSGFSGSDLSMASLVDDRGVIYTGKPIG
jgi:hypothetical protein